MRRIYITKYGIHFETDAGQINAHWDDLLGISTWARQYEHRIEFNWRFIKRFWEQLIEGIIFFIRGDFE